MSTEILLVLYIVTPQNVKIFWIKENTKVTKRFHVVEFKKTKSDDATKYITFYFNLKAETIINESDIDDVFQSVYTKIISKLEKYLGKGLGWIIDSVLDHIINILKYTPLAGSNCIKLPK